MKKDVVLYTQLYGLVKIWQNEFTRLKTQAQHLLPDNPKDNETLGNVQIKDPQKVEVSL